MKKKGYHKLKLPMRAYFLYIIIATLLITTVSLSKYVTSSSFKDSARVVRFGNISITETGPSEMIVEPGVDINKEVIIDFPGSESSCYVFVKLTVNNWKTEDNYKFISSCVDVGNKISWSVSNYWSYLENQNQNYVYYKELLPGDEIIKEKIIEDSKLTVSEELKNSELKKLDSPTISFSAAVIQSGGFKNAEDAWEYLSNL